MEFLNISITQHCPMINKRGRDIHGLIDAKCFPGWHLLPEVPPADQVFGDSALCHCIVGKVGSDATISGCKARLCYFPAV